MKPSGLAAATAIMLAGAVAWTAWADEATNVEIQAAFAEADVNEDEVINVDEYVGFSVRLFEAAGGTDDREIPKSELLDVEDADFARADRDQNGSLSLGEVVADKMLDFFETDTDQNGVLSLAEVLAAG